VTRDYQNSKAFGIFDLVVAEARLFGEKE